MGTAAERNKVVVVGSGLAGTATAIRLLRGAEDPLEIELWERRAAFRAGGPAYHGEGNPWAHIFNIQAGRMSLFREDTFDFIRWANLEADRAAWPAQWRDAEFGESSPAPRRIFQDYLTTRLAEARAEAWPSVALTEIDGEVVGLVPEPDGVRVLAAETRPTAERDADVVAGRPAGEADFVVLATGLELRNPPYATRVRDHPAYLREPYSAEGVKTLEGVRPSADVMIIGSVLSAYDTVSFLLSQGHTGLILLTSGSGTALQPYPEAHTHGVIELPAPSFEPADFGSRDAFLAAVQREWKAGCALAQARYPELPEAILPERVAKAWEPHAPAVLESLADEDLRSLLNEFGTLIAALRVGAMPQAVHPVHDALADGRQVRRVVGTVREIGPAPDGRLAVSVQAGSGELQLVECDLLVDSFGRQPNYRQVDSPLWRNLIAQQVATPHRRTGRGLEVDGQGHPISADGTRRSRISLVGGLREGDEIVRNGRFGAFSFNLAAIKNHSLAVAMDVLDSLELPAAVADPRAEALQRLLFADPDSRGRGPAAEALDLEVRRLSAAGRDERTRLADRLALCLDSLVSSGSVNLGAPERAARDKGGAGDLDLVHLAVRRQAVRLLCDISVSPKQLRQNLGLERAPSGHP